MNTPSVPTEVMTPGDDVLAEAIAADSMIEAAELEAGEKLKQEEAAVKAWGKKIDDARAFDKNARRQYAIDRTYVGGEAGRGMFDVTVNIAGTYVDILVAFLYARDPAVDVLASDSAGPSRLEDARQLSKTLEIVIAKLWKKGRLKQAARPWVRSGLSVAIGWFKACWHERRGQDPMTATRINDLQDNLRRLQASQAELAAGEAEDPDALKASIQSQIEGLEAEVEVVLSRGLAIDFVAAEDIQVSPECARLEDYKDSPWIAHRSFMLKDDACAAFPEIKDKLDQAMLYQQVAPRDLSETIAAGTLSEVGPDDADTFRAGGTLRGNAAGEAGHLCIWEIWNRDDNKIYTRIDGVPVWARQPYSPKPATTRFYPFFQWAPIQIDGRRHPESLPTRSAPQLDEYNRIRSNKREHRRRAIPKMGFNRRAVDVDQATRMESGAIGEMIGLDVLGDDAKNVVWPIQYNQIDPALYDTSDERSEIEMQWGLQEALSSTIRTAKTLGEAEIQQSGTQAREGHKRDSMEETLSDFAEYCAEIALQELDDDDVRALAGPEAFWPSTAEMKLSVEDLETLVSVEIRAGSSGKPNTSLRQEQWGTMMPVLEKAIEHIAALRQTAPLDTANCIEQLVIEMLDRVGDRLDPDRFLPPVGQPIMLIDPNTLQPVLAYPAPNQPAPPPGGAGPMPALPPGGGGGPLPPDPGLPPGPVPAADGGPIP